MSAIKIRREIDAPGFVEWLNAAVKASDLKLAAIALAADVSEGHFRRILKGNQQVITSEFLERVEKVLGCKFENGAN